VTINDDLCRLHPGACINAQDSAEADRPPDQPAQNVTLSLIGWSKSSRVTQDEDSGPDMIAYHAQRFRETWIGGDVFHRVAGCADQSLSDRLKHRCLVNGFDTIQRGQRPL